MKDIKHLQTKEEKPFNIEEIFDLKDSQIASQLKKPNLTVKLKKNICEQASDIVFKRSEEADRQYGPFSEGMDRSAAIFNAMTGLNLTGREMFKALIALKLSRESYHHKEDNLLDAIAYIAGLNNYEKGE
jgi:uncharacterized protein YllA (UPF0747 family)